MLLVEITINGVVNRVSVEGHGLSHNWKPRIIGFDAPTLALPSDHGGYAKLEFGGISFSPLLFVGDWPPPVSCPIAIYYTDTTEAARELLFKGMAHLLGFNRERISYSLYGPAYDEIISIMGIGTITVGQAYKITSYIADDDFTNVGAASNAAGVIFAATGTTPTHWAHFSTLAPYWNGTLNNVLANILLRIPEITTISTTYARTVSPNVTYTLTSDRIAINVASDIAEFYSHMIYIIDNTAYIVDMKRDNGTRTLTEYQYFAFPFYKYKTPVAAIESVSNGVTYRAASAYPYGEILSAESFHATKANIEAALADILAIENTPRVNFNIPMVAGNFPKMGEKIILPDTGNVGDLASYIRVRKIQYDFIENTINIEGEGAITG